MELACLAQLERSHRRDDEVMAELLDAARRFAAGRPEAGDLARVHDAMAYLEDTVTRHFVDEDGSVFPRLSMRRPELAALLAVLSGEHPTQIAIQAELAAAVRALDGAARPSAGKALLDAATKLAEAHHAHAAREDAIFEGAHAALTAQDDREIIAEMEMRRGMRGKKPAAAVPRSAKATAQKTAASAPRAAKRIGKKGTAKPAPRAAKPAPRSTTPATRVSSRSSTKKPARQR